MNNNISDDFIIDNGQECTCRRRYLCDTHPCTPAPDALIILQQTPSYNTGRHGNIEGFDIESPTGMSDQNLQTQTACAVLRVT
jgi:hypothetical protein